MVTTGLAPRSTSVKLGPVDRPGDNLLTLLSKMLVLAVLLPLNFRGVVEREEK